MMFLAWILLVLAPQASDSFLTWSKKQAEDIVEQRTRKGWVRGTQSYWTSNNPQGFEIKATWLSPDVVRATARIWQLRDRLSDDETRQLVREAEQVEGIVFFVQIRAKEGSGAIPEDSGFYLSARGAEAERAVKGASQRLRDVRALSGKLPVDFRYDRFWYVFPRATSDGRALFTPGTREASLVVRMQSKECTITLPVPVSESDSR